MQFVIIIKKEQPKNRMKKLFITMCVVLLSMTAQAQQKGDFALGLHLGPTFGKVEFMGLKEHTTTFGIGAFAQYNFATHWRAELEANYHPKKDHVSDVLVALNVHYLINVAENFKIYPLLGYGVTFVHSDLDGDENETDSGVQLGAGMQYDLSGQYFISGEYKYQPGLFGDSHVLLFGVGMRF